MEEIRRPVQQMVGEIPRFDKLWIAILQEGTHSTSEIQIIEQFLD